MTNYVAYNLEASSSWQRQLRKLVPSLDQIGRAHV